MECAIVELDRVGRVAEIAKVVQLAQAEDLRVIPQIRLNIVVPERDAPVTNTILVRCGSDESMQPLT